MSLKSRTKKYLVKILETANKPFYDDNGNEITAEQFAEQLLGMSLEDARELQAEIEKRKQNEQNDKKDNKQ